MPRFVMLLSSVALVVLEFQREFRLLNVLFGFRMAWVDGGVILELFEIVYSSHSVFYSEGLLFESSVVQSEWEDWYP